MHSLLVKSIKALVKDSQNFLHISSFNPLAREQRIHTRSTSTNPPNSTTCKRNPQILPLDLISSLIRFCLSPQRCLERKRIGRD
ncbi:hypothetical protein GIB67_010408 [Kingdonia uniflora]|uniref:Uncharacterized protein n=1 Tax=Kingdonia uniflora TaxID=39325 RepID=A0A7J7MAM5_9MAGN|nr:hypothetical protein GIB67_010408 [Kingdonia uniflora]